jgi:hypothetical protein
MRKSVTFITILWSAGTILPLVLVLFNIHFYPHFMVGSGDTGEYLPVAASPLIVQQEPADQTIPNKDVIPNADTLAGKTVTFHRFYWESWYLFADDKEIPTTADSLGRAIAKIPEGTHRLRWELQQTSAESAGLWISAFTAAGICLALGFGLVRRMMFATPTVSKMERMDVAK